MALPIGLFLCTSFLYYNGCLASFQTKRFLKNSNQTDIPEKLAQLESTFTNQEHQLDELKATIADLTTQVSRQDASIGDLWRNKTTCNSGTVSNIGEMHILTRNISSIFDKLAMQSLETKNLSAIIGSVSRQVSGTYELLEELVSLPAAEQLKLALQNSDLKSILRNITANTEPKCMCNLTDNSQQIADIHTKLNSSILDIGNIKTRVGNVEIASNQQARSIQTLRQQLNGLEQKLNAPRADVSNVTARLNVLTQEVQRQQNVIQDMTSARTTSSPLLTAQENKIENQGIQINQLTNTIHHQQNFINYLVGWIQDAINLPCTTGSIHNLCPTGSYDVTFHKPFHEAPSVTASATQYYIPTKAVTSNMVVSLSNITPSGFKVTGYCGSGYQYATEVTWHACVKQLTANY